MEKRDKDKLANDKPDNKLQKNALEWSVFAFSLVLVLGTLGFLAYDALTQGQDAARLEVRPGAIRETGAPSARFYVVPITVFNKGDFTAEGVAIEVVIEKNKREIERAEVEIAYVPRRSQAEASVVFSRDPRKEGELKSRVIGYQEP